METAVQPGRFGTIAKELKEAVTINQTEEEEKLLASLSGMPAWEVLRTRIERQIEALHKMTKIDSSIVAEMTDMELHGFRCFTKDLLVEQLELVVNQVELTAKYFKDSKKAKKPDNEPEESEE